MCRKASDLLASKEGSAKSQFLSRFAAEVAKFPVLMLFLLTSKDRQ